MSLVAAKSPKLNIRADVVSELRDWRCEHGQSVRQVTVRNLSTKDKPGTLPMNCYTFQPDTPAPVDICTLDISLLPQQQTLPHRAEVAVLFKKATFATIKSTSGCSVVRFREAVLLTDEVARVDIYEQMLTVLEYVLSRSAEINTKQICKEVAVELADDTLRLGKTITTLK